jgi:hypothetical protein
MYTNKDPQTGCQKSKATERDKMADPGSDHSPKRERCIYTCAASERATPDTHGINSKRR